MKKVMMVLAFVGLSSSVFASTNWHSFKNREEAEVALNSLLEDVFFRTNLSEDEIDLQQNELKDAFEAVWGKLYEAA